MTEIAHTSSFSDLVLAGKVWGREDAPHRVLAVHGWMDNAATWDHLAPLLVAAADVRLVAIDLPGHGQSEHRSGKGPYNFLEYIPDIISFADGLGWDSFSLMGHSLGAGLTSIIAGLYASRVKHLIVVEGLGPWTNPKKSNFVDDFNKAMFTNKMVHSRPPPVYADLDAAVDRWCESQPQMKRESVVKLVTRSIKQVENGVVFSQDRSLRCSSLLRMNEEQVTECLERIACPIVVVLGDQGFLFTDYEPLFKQLYPIRKKAVAKQVVREIVVPGGHHPHLDNPEPVVREIAALFASPSPAAAKQ
ncbi:hydrolase, alpha/beta fold domain containing protein [Acanthamoeba castellanii str. Neff]|uniref:Hydrolase, alpha/beta fold domain containing protein n=1 Tax=Acanthamoeba castellanii (strain ATCC 30010 / Neff) TaxID=1257118 RepID=L8GXI6_ACACF|nr:hydrolase, alpha/beta fold domain containing protein [Acanthamoeba castellanii str. Neff]ELR17979.1 hydrolase, alpha/beta fold domain containing protein [Acanthamoeba castellanii str. Neff]